MNTREANLERVFREHARPVAAFAARILGDAELARDVCQETFVRFFDHMDDVGKDPGPWLRVVASRLALDLLRRRSAETRALEKVERAEATTPDARDALELEDERRRILAALAELPDRQREAITLRVFSGDSFPAIARALRVSEGSAKTHFRRGIERLKDLLTERTHGLR